MQTRYLRFTIAAIALALITMLAPSPGWTMTQAPGEAPAGGEYEIRGRIREDGVDLPGITVNLYLSTNPTVPIDSTTTGGDGRYAFTEVDNGSYIVRPVDLAYDFDPPHRNVIILAGDVANQDFNAIFREYDVDGRVVDDGSGLADIVVRLYELPDTTTPVRNTVTDNQGYYLFADMVPGEYRVRPEHIDYTFVPPYRDLTVTNAPVTAADIEGNLNTYSASGRVSDNGTAMADVTVTLALTQEPETILQTASSNASGDYVFSGVEPGTYRITPTLEDYLFIPDYRDVPVSGGDVVNVNFEANLNIFNVSGRVTDNGAPVGQVQMVLTAQGNPNPVAYAVTNSNGDYQFVGIDPGSYRVTPVRGGYAFVPPYRDFTISNGDVSGLNFEANVMTYEATGRVEDDGEGLAGVTVQLSLATNPNPIDEVMTDADGNFSFESLSPNEYRVTPVYPMYSFEPPSIPFTVSTANVPNLFFEGNTYALYLPMSIRQGQGPPSPTPTPTATPVPCRLEIEPNALADADANGNFEPGRCINGAIPAGDQNDFYRIQFPGGTFNASLTAIPDGTDYDLTLYRMQNGQPVLVTISNNSGTQNENIQYSNLAAGAYYIGVQRYTGNSPELYRLVWTVNGSG